MVAAVNGSVEIEDQTIDFLLQEEDTRYDGKTDTFELKKGDYFPRAKVLRLTIFKIETNKCQQVLTYFDDILIEIVEESEVERLVQCLPCDKKSYFTAARGFQPVNKLDKCSKGIHGWDKDMVNVNVNRGPVTSGPSRRSLESRSQQVDEAVSRTKIII